VQFVFADHVLYTDRREPRRDSELMAVEPQVNDLLVILFQNRDRVVRRDDVIASVWGGRITSRIYAVRKVVATVASSKSWSAPSRAMASVCGTRRSGQKRNLLRI
jgi:DNA-binding winged helix-turn-helix (wHTH) protein